MPSKGLDPSIAAIPHPTGDLMTAGRALHRIAETHALH